MWIWFWLGITGRSWKNFDVYDRKTLHCLQGTTGKTIDIKGTAGEGSEEVRKMVEEASITLETKYTIMNRTLREIETLKKLQERFQTK